MALSMEIRVAFAWHWGGLRKVILMLKATLILKVYSLLFFPNHRIAESQNHRMAGVGRDLCGSSSPTPCRSRVTQSRLHRTASRQVFNTSTGESPDPLGSLCRISINLRGKKFSLMFRWNFLCFSLCPLPLVLSLATTEKSLDIHPPDTHP